MSESWDSRKVASLAKSFTTGTAAFTVEEEEKEEKDDDEDDGNEEPDLRCSLGKCRQYNVSPLAAGSESRFGLGTNTPDRLQKAMALVKVLALHEVG